MKNPSADHERPRPQIVENYRDFTPPPWLRRLIENAVDSVPEYYLAGLGTVVLTNQSALTRDQRRQKLWQRGRSHRLADCRGLYYPATRSGAASVWLLVDNIMRPLPSWYFRIPTARAVEFGEVLFHEIGHHIHAEHKPVYDGKENVAEDWSRKLGLPFFRRRYWYAIPLILPLVHLFDFAKSIKKRLSRRTVQRA